MKRSPPLPVRLKGRLSAASSTLGSCCLYTFVILLVFSICAYLHVFVVAKSFQLQLRSFPNPQSPGPSHRPDTPDPSDRPESPDRSDHPESPDRSDRPQSPERTARPDSPDSSDRPYRDDLEFRLVGTLLKWEGLGAVLSNLKPVLILKNYTGALITIPEAKNSGHGYMTDRYVRFDERPTTKRVNCTLSKSIATILANIVEECEHFNYSKLETEYGMFRNCNTVYVARGISHPRKCLKYSQDLVRNITKFRIEKANEKRDVCVMRRGGDVESKIRAGVGNMWAIDEKKTFPILAEISKRKGRIVVTTETRSPEEVRKAYYASVLSNMEPLDKVVKHLSSCRCLFVASGSSFGSAMVQLTRPTYIVYTESREGFKYTVRDYEYKEYGAQAVSVLSGTKHVADLCTPST